MCIQSFFTVKCLRTVWGHSVHFQLFDDIVSTFNLNIRSGIFVLPSLYFTCILLCSKSPGRMSRPLGLLFPLCACSLKAIIQCQRNGTISPRIVTPLPATCTVLHPLLTMHFCRGESWCCCHVIFRSDQCRYKLVKGHSDLMTLAWLLERTECQIHVFCGISL